MSRQSYLRNPCLRPVSVSIRPRPAHRLQVRAMQQSLQELLSAMEDPESRAALTAHAASLDAKVAEFMEDFSTAEVPAASARAGGCFGAFWSVFFGRLVVGGSLATVAYSKG